MTLEKMTTIFEYVEDLKNSFSTTTSKQTAVATVSLEETHRGHREAFVRRPEAHRGQGPGLENPGHIVRPSLDVL